MLVLQLPDYYYQDRSENPFNLPEQLQIITDLPKADAILVFLSGSSLFQAITIRSHVYLPNQSAGL
jgi:hypothetical protein